MSQIVVRQFDERDRADVIATWAACGLVRSTNDPAQDIDRKIAVDDSMFLVAVDDDSVVGTVMAGYDGHRGWINYLAVAPMMQGQGIGALLMENAERRLRKIGCAKINLQIRTDNASAAAFYDRLGYRRDEVVSLGKRLIADSDDHRVAPSEPGGSTEAAPPIGAPEN